MPLNGRYGRESTQRLPWIPQQFSALCRNTGLSGMRLRSDQLQNAPVQPTPNLNNEVKSGRSISTTYLTRKGYLFLYPSSLEVEAWEQQVTPAELHNLVKTKINQSLHHEGKNHRTAFLNNHLKIIGVLKRNLEFPETWCSPGRETVPPLATMKGLSCAEFLRDQGSRKTYASSSHEETGVGFIYKPLDDKTYEHYPWALTPSETRRNKYKGQRWITGNKNNRVTRINCSNRRVHNLGMLTCRVPSMEINSSNSTMGESTRLMSRSSLASETISLIDGQWASNNTVNDEFALQSPRSEEDSEWTHVSSATSVRDFHGVNDFRDIHSKRNTENFKLSRRLKPLSIHKTQVNANAVCPESTISARELNSSANQEPSPTLNTFNTNTATTCPSSRWSRATPTAAHQRPFSPGRVTPASTPSRKLVAAQPGLLETAKLLLSESSKLEPVLLTRDQVHKQLAGERIVGGVDAGGERVETTERARNHRERKRQREAMELQKQITALDATIERLHKRTKQKVAILNKITLETLNEIKLICVRREAERRSVLGQKRRITKELFLCQFRNRQLRRRNLRRRLGLIPGSHIRVKFTGSAGPVPISLAAREESEQDALTKWGAAEDVRDEAEVTLAQRLEEDAATKATNRLKWLKDVATAQLKHLEEFIRVNHPTEEENPSSPNEVVSETQLPQLREKHQRLVALLQKYGVPSSEDDDKSSRIIQQLDTGDTLPTTVALRTLWSELEEEKLCKLQEQTINEFEKLVRETYRTSMGRKIKSPKFRRRYQWRREAYMYNEFTKPVTTKTFSYFDFWPTPVSESSEEEEDEKHEFIRNPWSQLSTTITKPVQKKTSERLSGKQSTPSWSDQSPMRFNLEAS